MHEQNNPYYLAQSALAQLKTAVYILLKNCRPDGLRNADVGRSLGIYMGHADHEGHISRTLLAIMEAEGVVEQDKKSKLWTLRAVITPNSDG